MIAYSFILARFDRKLTFPYRMASVKTGLPAYAYVILIVGFAAWFLPFPLAGWSRKSPQKRDSRWRWGLLLEAAGYVILWQGPFWSRPLPSWRLALSVLFLALASLLSWTSTRALGRYLRFGAAVDEDHQLIRSGPYRVVRHPIYASMLCMFLGMGFMVAPPLHFFAGLIFFIAGTEIRVRVEDRLLADRFGEEFREYRRSTPAYIPLLR
jgi:protein-S-isoprenylcysteine O-methyltransferase Ste14